MLYRLDDSGRTKGVFKCNYDEAKEWNEKGWGIFWTVNLFKDDDRRSENLVKIQAWATDLDFGTKLEQSQRIKDAPLEPSMIIETARGFHVYYCVKDGTEATIKNYNEIVGKRLIPYFKGDRNAKDLTRILRASGYYHMKNPNKPYMCKIWQMSGLEYTEQEMMKMFKPEAEKKEKIVIVEEQKEIDGEGFWEKAGNIDCRYALQELSGSSAICGDVIKFRNNGAGTYQIICNDKSTSCWVDSNGQIGSHDKGGPGISNWLYWYHKDWKTVYRILKERFGGILCKK